jgi:transketolase
VALILTRQALPTFDRTKYAPAAGVARGAYILADAEGGKPQVILMATGSEVYLCIDAYEKLKAEGIRAALSACHRGTCSNIRTRVIAMRCCRRR